MESDCVVEESLEHWLSAHHWISLPSDLSWTRQINSLKFNRNISKGHNLHWSKVLNFFKIHAYVCVNSYHYQLKTGIVYMYRMWS